MKNLARKLNGVFVGALLSMPLLPIDVFAAVSTATDMSGTGADAVIIKGDSIASKEDSQQPMNIDGCWIIVNGVPVYICHHDDKEAGNA